MTKHTQGSWWHGGSGCCILREEDEDDHGEILPERHIACTWHTNADGGKTDTYSREDEANAARIVACVNALDGIADPEAFVKAAIKIHGFAAAYTGNGCKTETESRWADAGLGDPETLAAWVDALRAALGGEPTATEDDR
jgi:hypothetical protein